MIPSQNRSNGRLFTGLILIVGGLLLLAYKRGYPIPAWVLSWQMLLIEIGIVIGIKNRFQNFGWLILIAIGSFFLVEQEFAFAAFHQYFWPTFIILAGIFFILNRKRNLSGCKKKWQQDYQNINAVNSPANVQINEDDAVNINSIFSGIQHTVISKNFLGGKINSVFGGVEIDCTQAVIQTAACLQIEAVFSGVKLIVPQNWIVQNEMDGVFHGVDDKRKFSTINMYNDSKILTLKGFAVFAGIEIKSS
jgi:hypothetical protein